MELLVKFRAEDLHLTYCTYFRTNLLFWWSIFGGTNIHRTAIYITYPISSNSCKTSSLHCYPLYNFPSFRNSHWRCFVRKGVPRNFAKFTGKRLWQSFFFNTFADWENGSWSFSCLLLKISCLFHLNRKMRWEKGNTLMEFKYLVRVSICLTSKISNKKLRDGNLIRKCA